MKIVVVGPGAMGTLFAGLLVSGGHEVWLLGRRPEVVDAITPGRDLGAGRTHKTVPVRAIRSLGTWVWPTWC